MQPHRGVLVVAGAPRTWEQQVKIATASLSGTASHRCAARLHGLDGFDSAPVEITITYAGTRRPHENLVHRTRRVDRRATTIIDGIPVTTVARTLVDLGAVVDDDAVEQAVDDALRRGFNLRWINETLERATRPGPTGVAALRRVLARPDRAGPMPDSMFERLIERIAVAAGLPAPVRQLTVRDGDRIVARLDAAWPGERLALEADSEMWHSGPRRGRRARARHNQLTALGWEVLYASWQDADDPGDLTALVVAAFLRDRG